MVRSRSRLRKHPLGRDGAVQGADRGLLHLGAQHSATSSTNRRIRALALASATPERLLLSRSNCSISDMLGVSRAASWGSASTSRSCIRLTRSASIAPTSGPAAERALQPARVGLPAASCPAVTVPEPVAKTLSSTFDTRAARRTSAARSRALSASGPGGHQAVELGGQLRVALHDGVDGGLRVQQCGRQPDVLDDGEARRLQGGLLLVVEQPGEQPPVLHLTAVPWASPPRGRCARSFPQQLSGPLPQHGHGVGGGLLGLHPGLVGGAAGPAAGVDRDSPSAPSSRRPAAGRGTPRRPSAAARCTRRRPRRPPG